MLLSPTSKLGYLSFKLFSHCWIITESEDTQSVVQSDEICSDCFSPIVSIPLPDCLNKFFNDSEKLPPIVRLSLTF